MRFSKILYYKIKIAAIILLSLSINGKIYSQGKTEKNPGKIEVTVHVQGPEGEVLPKAQIVVGEGVIHATTDENGNFTFKAKPDDFVAVSKSGYEKSVLLVSQLLTDSNVALAKSKLMMTAEDNVELPFMTIKKRYLAGSSSMLKSAQLERYPSTDIRNALTGLANGLNVQEMHGAPGMSAEEERGTFRFDEKISVTSRGRSMRYIVDNIPTDITEMPLDPNEIESVTVIKDIVGKSMFGPEAADGVILIKTKRGRTNERILNVNVESGVSMIDRFPEFVSGADYARLNNMARVNSGLDPLYSDADIAAYGKNDPYDMVHPSVDYRDIMLKNSMGINRINISSTGGNDVVKYFSYLGYAGEGDIYKIGAKSDYNRINARSNIDVKVNDFINIQFDFFGGLTFRRSPNYGYDAQFTSEGTDNPALDIVEFGTVINDIDRTPPVAFPIYANNDPALKSPWYAVSAAYDQNPVGNLVKNGYYTESGRTGLFNLALDYDMSSIAKGLTSKTYLGFNAFNLVRIGKAEDYTAYTVTPVTADSVTLTKVHDGVDQADQAKLHDYYYQRFAVYETLNYDKTFGKNSLQTALTYYLSKVSRNGIEEPQRHQSGILTAVYSYDDKYNIQGVLNYTGASTFGKDSRYYLSPTIGASWIISDEGFLEDAKFLDYLKLRAEYGVLAYDAYLSPYYYRSDWNYNSSGAAFGPASANQWFGSATDNTVYRTVESRTGNPDVTWETRKEFNAGIDAQLFKNKLTIEANYYNQLRNGAISQIANAIPYIAGVSSWLPRANYNNSRYTGVELALQYTNNEHKFQYSFGGNATIQHSKYEKYDEPNYRFDYQSRLGKPVDAIFGQTNIGKFASDQEALEVPQLFDEVLSAGDLKYKDMNGDGVVDDNDQSMIGHSTPRLYYSLNVKFNYKNFELFVLGTGYAFYDILLNNKYYQNGWGDDNYSAFVRDNIGGAYPKLTYYKVNNNFVTSDFWLTKGGFFKVQNAELAYNVPVYKMKWSAVEKMKIFVRGANLFTLTKVKDIDPESKNSGLGTVADNDTDRGLYPLFRTITGGIKLTF